MKREFKRITGEEWIGGVCAGLAYWLGIPTWLVRLCWVGVSFFSGVGIIIYILLWIFTPEWDATPDDYEEITE